MPRPRLAITLGDPCGIGPEILVRSLATLEAWGEVQVIGAKAGLELLDFAKAEPTWREAATRLRSTAAWIDPTPEIQARDLTLGQASAASGRCAVEAVRIGAALVMEGRADALVTLPLSKAAAHLAGYDIPGHTELLQALSGAAATRMAFVSPRLNVVLHTVHQSLRSVIDTLDAAAVAETLTFSASHFARYLGLDEPGIALCALNPHAGEEGAFGSEEGLLREALAQASAQSPARFSGPWPADTVFLRALQGEFDLVVALYHDQGLIPIKVLEPARAVNLTVGLPFVRTSPDHGTAFDKAGRWQADATNFLHAAALAIRLAGRARGAAWQAEVPDLETWK